MTYPFNTNMVEKLPIDPIKQLNGMIWFNTTDKVYKAYIDETLHVFLTDGAFQLEVENFVGEAFSKKQFIIDFASASSVIIKHNKNSRHFNYQLTESITQSTLLASIVIVDENEVRFDFVDPISGSLFMNFA